MERLEKWTVEFYTAIANYKWADLESYIESITNLSLHDVDNSEIQYKNDIDDKQSCPTDPFLRVMCEWCQ